MRCVRVKAVLLSLSTLFSFCFALFFTAHTHAENSATLPELKAAYLFNFTQFIEWPEHAFASTDASFKLCLLGIDDVMDKLEGVLAHKYQHRDYDIKVINSVSQSMQCQLLFFDTNSPAQTRHYLDAVSKSAILTVSMEDKFIHQGGMIGFRQVDNNLRFEVNHDAMLKAGLKPSATMLEVADHIIQQDSADK